VIIRLRSLSFGLRSTSYDPTSRRDKSAFAESFRLRFSSYDRTSRPDKKKYKIQQWDMRDVLYILSLFC